jgi:hypothetical protein
LLVLLPFAGSLFFVDEEDDDGCDGCDGWLGRLGVGCTRPGCCSMRDGGVGRGL